MQPLQSSPLLSSGLYGVFSEGGEISLWVMEGSRLCQTVCAAVDAAQRDTRLWEKKRKTTENISFPLWMDLHSLTVLVKKSKVFQPLLEQLITSSVQI